MKLKEKIKTAKKKKKSEHALTRLWNKVKWPNIHVIDVPKNKERE